MFDLLTVFVASNSANISNASMYLTIANITWIQKSYLSSYPVRLGLQVCIIYAWTWVDKN